MTKVRIIVDDFYVTLENKINDFIRDKDVVSIQYCGDRAMVVYEERKE